MATVPTVEQLYDAGNRLAEAKEDVGKLEDDYRRIVAAARGDNKTQQLAAQFIPKFFKTFPEVQLQAMSAQLDLCEEDEFAVRVQAIRGLPQIAKDVPEYLQKSADILTQLLQASEALELEAVKKALMTLLRLDAKTTLQAVFQNLESADSDLKPLVHHFLKDKVFPTRQDWMKAANTAELEKVLSELVSQALSSATPAEVREYLELLLSLNLYSQSAGKDAVQALLDAVSKKAGQNDAIDVSDAEALQNLLDVTTAAIPLLKRGGTSSSLVHQLVRTILPAFDKISPPIQLSFLKTLADTSSYVSGSDARMALPVLLEVIKKLLPRRKDSSSVTEGPEYFASAEAALYVFHQLANKVPNATNPLCGYKNVTGQPSDRLNEDFTAQYSEFTERLAVVEERSKKVQKALTEAHQKAIKEGKDSKDAVEGKAEREAESKAREGQLTSLKNVINLTKPLHARTPKFIAQAWLLSWHDAPAPASGAKRAGDTIGASQNKRPAPDSKASGGRGPQNGAQRGRGRGAGSGGGGRGAVPASGGHWRGGRGGGGNRGRGRGGRGRY